MTHGPMIPAAAERTTAKKQSKEPVQPERTLQFHAPDVTSKSVEPSDGPRYVIGEVGAMEQMGPVAPATPLAYKQNAVIAAQAGLPFLPVSATAADAAERAQQPGMTRPPVDESGEEGE